ncbi:MAG: hypothetical protein QXE15_06035 [Candidatus Bathyarchaeia archaeon]
MLFEIKNGKCPFGKDPVKCDRKAKCDYKRECLIYMLKPEMEIFHLKDKPIGWRVKWMINRRR